MKTTKQRLQELAGVRSSRKMNEAYVSLNSIVKLNVSVNVQTIINMFGGEDMLDPSVMADPNKFKQFTSAIAEDLSRWMDQGDDLSDPQSSRTWAEDGVDLGVYDDFIAKD